MARERFTRSAINLKKQLKISNSQSIAELLLCMMYWKLYGSDQLILRVSRIRCFAFNRSSSLGQQVLGLERVDNDLPSRIYNEQEILKPWMFRG